MTKKIIAALLLVVVCTTGLLAGCGTTPVTEADFDKIATFYFNNKVGEDAWVDYRQEQDIFIQGKEAYCLTALDETGNSVYCIGIAHDGSGVYKYGLTTGKASRIGGCNIESYEWILGK